ncbi:hypothetical protein F66182_13084, partial [Fusarium sp. NRRL 66182]
MSRFFHGGGSDSESRSSDEEELYSDHDEEEKSEEEESSEEDFSEEEDSEEESSEDEDRPKKTGANIFLKDEGEDSDESEDEDKVTVVKSAKDKRLEELESTVKLIENAEKIGDWAVISTEFDKLNRQQVKITQSGPTPKVYIKAIADLEDYINETIAKQKTSGKKMNASNTKGLNAVRQRIKKNNKDFQVEIDKYRTDKDGYMEAVEAEEVKVEKPSRVRVTPTLDALSLADEEGFSTVGRGGKTLQYTPESILKHLRIIVESRGKKNTDRLEQIRTMEKLLEVAQTPYQQIRVYLTLIATRFDLTTSTANHMSPEQWKAAETEFTKLLAVLEENRNHIVTEGAEEWEDDDKLPTVAEGEVLRVPGSIVSFVERLDDELTRSLQHIDPHTA